MRPNDVVCLSEARQRVGQIIGVPPDRRLWSPMELRWLVDQWRLALPLPELEPKPPALPDDVPVLTEGLRWWLFDSPRILRGMTAFVVLFTYSFGYGWMSG